MDIIGTIGHYDLVSMTLITMQAEAPNDACRRCRRWRNRGPVAARIDRIRPGLAAPQVQFGGIRHCIVQ
jgi:4-carboxymuconolactone decarboxylase